MKTNAMLILFLSFSVLFNNTLFGQTQTSSIKLPLAEVVNLVEGPLFNRIKIYLDDYRSKGHSGENGWIKFGNKQLAEIPIGKLYQTAAQRWHLDDMMSTGVDLRPDPSGDPRKWIVSVEFETDDREIICITRISKNKDNASSGHIRNPQVDIYLTLVNSGNFVSYRVDKVSWKGKVDINVYINAIDNAINKKVRPQIQANVFNSMNNWAVKSEFTNALKKVIGTANARFQQLVQQKRIDSPKIIGFNIDGKYLIVRVQGEHVPKRAVPLS